MGCLPNISIALSLLALTAGVWFLYKVQKENLGILYKIAAWFVIIVTILNLACCGLRCCMGSCMGMGGACMPGGPGMQMMHNRMMNGGCGDMMYGRDCGMGRGHGRCDRDEEKCCRSHGRCDDDDENCKEGSSCEWSRDDKKGEKGEMKIIIKKDSVVKTK